MISGGSVHIKCLDTRNGDKAMVRNGRASSNNVIIQMVARFSCIHGLFIPEMYRMCRVFMILECGDTLCS